METLRTVKHIAPEWLRRSGLAKVTVRELLDRPHRSRGVVTLARFIGVAS